MTTEKPCKDCAADWNGNTPPPRYWRPAPNPGPRCSTHWRTEVNRRKAATHDKRVQATYGLEPGEYDRLYEFQGGRCALCRRARGMAKKLAVDHDHATGAPRGLLCSVCNRLLGHARDQIGFFRRCIVYLYTTPYERMRNGQPFHEGL